MENENRQADMIRKVQALYAKVDSPATTDAERNAAIVTAQKIIAKYRIEQDQLVEVDRDEFVYVPHAIEFDCCGPMTRRMIDLAIDIAQPLGVACAYWSGHHGTNRVGMWGRRSSIENVKMLYTVCSGDALRQVKKLKARRAKTAEEYDTNEDDPALVKPWATQGELKAHTNSLRFGFLAGYRREVARRLRETHEEIDTEAGGTYLPMLASDYRRAVALQPKMRSGTSVGSGNSAGQRAGREAGSRVSLAGTSMPSAPRQLAR